MPEIHTLGNPYITILTIFILACFVGYYVVWKVTPALHTPNVSHQCHLQYHYTWCFNCSGK